MLDRRDDDAALVPRAIGTPRIAAAIASEPPLVKNDAARRCAGERGDVGPELPSSSILAERPSAWIDDAFAAGRVEGGHEGLSRSRFRSGDVAL
jgi:hypothetical protein